MVKRIEKYNTNQSSFPQNPVKDMEWRDLNNNILWKYNGSQWTQIGTYNQQGNLIRNTEEWKEEEIINIHPDTIETKPLKDARQERTILNNPVLNNPETSYSNPAIGTTFIIQNVVFTGSNLGTNAWETIIDLSPYIPTNASWALFNIKTQAYAVAARLGDSGSGRDIPIVTTAGYITLVLQSVGTRQFQTKSATAHTTEAELIGYWK